VGNAGATGNLGTGGVTDNAILVYDRNNSLTEGNSISGTGVVQQAGTGGTTILTGPTTMVGVRRSAPVCCRLATAARRAISARAVWFDNATLAYNRSNTITEGNVISGSGALSQLGTGTLILTATNIFTGGTSIYNGKIQLNNSLSLQKQHREPLREVTD